MKKILMAALLCAGLNTLQSCKKTAATEAVKEPANTFHLQKNQSFSYNFGLLAANDTLIITRQPLHFSYNKIEKDKNTFFFYYNYHPTSNYVGNDEVHIVKYTVNGTALTDSVKTVLQLVIGN